MEKNIYYPVVYICVSHFQKPIAGARSITFKTSSSTFSLQTKEELKDYIPDVAKLCGIQIDVLADQSEPNPSKRSVRIKFIDSTPRKTFPSHNKTLILRPNESHSIIFNMGDNQNVMVDCAHLQIAHDHAILPDKEFYEFLGKFTRMKPVVEEYERINRYGTQYEKDAYRAKYKETLDIYEEYYQPIGIKGMDARVSKPRVDEMV